MIIAIGEAVSDYIYDVFILKFDFWLAFGIVAQLLFTARFLVQWLASEREGRSVMPMSFWYFSMGGGLMTLIYGIVRREPIIIMGQALAMIIYTRNMILIFREKRALSAKNREGA